MAEHEAEENKKQIIVEDDDGLLSQFFGDATDAPTNIAGLAVMILLLAGLITLFTKTQIPSLEFWKMITPVLTMTLGYLFGASGRKPRNQ